MWSWLLNPGMLLAGGLAATIPIIIHLLNKRRYRIVQWAAMDFLLEADKKNRRRVRLENLILLALRCLAMFLLGLLLARPLVPSSAQFVFGQKMPVERVVVVDDSLSQWVLRDGQPAIDGVKSGLKEWLAQLARSETTEDWLTLYVTSRPDQPILSYEPVTNNTLIPLQETVDRLSPTDFAADYRRTFHEILRYLQGQRAGVTRVAYVFSDLRQRDWLMGGDAEQMPNRLLQRMGEYVGQGFVIDTGSPADDNLAITELTALDPIVANRIVRFQASVSNFGTRPLRDVRVSLQIDDQPPIYELIPSLAAGAVETVTYRTLFRPSRWVGAGERSLDAQRDTAWRNYRLRVEIDRAALGDDQLSADQLSQDNVRWLALRVADGIPVLLVDGDPSPVPQRNETFFLKYLDVFGTGLRTTVIPPTELETVSLSNYEVIFVCNVDSVSRDRTQALQRWVEDGGALVLMPGNQVRAALFNETFYQGGQGLSPLELIAVTGDPTQSTWVNFEADPQPHPALQTIMATDATSLSRADVFTWWSSRLDPERLGRDVQVILRLTDSDRSPAMVERKLGRGRVFTFALPGDSDWTIWPTTPTFVPVILDMIDDALGRRGIDRQAALGEPLVETVDLTRFDRRVQLLDPREERTESIARPVEGSVVDSGDELQEVSFSDVARAGFYELTLHRTDGELETRLWAVNLPASESRLTRLTAAQRESDFWGDRFEVLASVSEAVKAAAGQSREFWWYVVVLLLFVLGTEQFLGWWFGRRR